MLDDILKKMIIQLPELKKPEEIGRFDGPKYCRYHRMISHPLETCSMLKEHIMRLAKDERIVLNLDDVVETNHIFHETKRCLSSDLEVWSQWFCTSMGSRTLSCKKYSS